MDNTTADREELLRYKRAIEGLEALLLRHDDLELSPPWFNSNWSITRQECVNGDWEMVIKAQAPSLLEVIECAINLEENNGI